MPANENQVGGNHYKTSIEHWDYVLANDIPYLEAQIIKYTTRWRKKNGLQDLQKAQHFLEKLIEVNTDPPPYTRCPEGTLQLPGDVDPPIVDSPIPVMKTPVDSPIPVDMKTPSSSNIHVDMKTPMSRPPYAPSPSLLKKPLRDDDPVHTAQIPPESCPICFSEIHQHLSFCPNYHAKDCPDTLDGDNVYVQRHINTLKNQEPSS